MIMIVGMIVFPIPREAAIVQSIKDEKQYENAMILILLHAGVNDCCIRGKQRQELMSEDKEEQSKDQSDRE